MLELRWSSEYPENEAAEVSMAAFYNKHVGPAVKARIEDAVKAEAEQVCTGSCKKTRGRDRTDLGSGRSFGAIKQPKLWQNRLRPNFQDPVYSAESVKARASALNRSFGQFDQCFGRFT